MNQEEIEDLFCIWVCRTCGASRNSSLGKGCDLCRRARSQEMNEEFMKSQQQDTSHMRRLQTGW